MLRDKYDLQSDSISNCLPAAATEKMHPVVHLILVYSALFSASANEVHPVGSRQCMLDEYLHQELLRMKCE